MHFYTFLSHEWHQSNQEIWQLANSYQILQITIFQEKQLLVFELSFISMKGRIVITGLYFCIPDPPLALP